MTAHTLEVGSLCEGSMDGIFMAGILRKHSYVCCGIFSHVKIKLVGCEGFCEQNTFLQDAPGEQRPGWGGPGARGCLLGVRVPDRGWKVPGSLCGGECSRRTPGQASSWGGTDGTQGANPLDSLAQRGTADLGGHPASHLSPPIQRNHGKQLQ